MQVGEVEQRDLAGRLEGEQIGLGRLAPLREGVAAQGRNRGRSLQQRAAANTHCPDSLQGAHHSSGAIF
jgi:hypothetical protein